MDSVFSLCGTGTDCACISKEKGSEGRKHTRGEKLFRSPKMNLCRHHSPTLRIQMSWMQATKRPRMSMSKSSLASFRLPACLPVRLSQPPARPPASAGCCTSPPRGSGSATAPGGRPRAAGGRDQRRWELRGRGSAQRMAGLRAERGSAGCALRPGWALCAAVRPLGVSAASACVACLCVSVCRVCLCVPCVSVCAVYVCAGGRRPRSAGRARTCARV